MHKRLFSLLLALTLAVMLSGCTAAPAQSEPETSALITPTPADTCKIGILMLSESASMDSARESFLARLDEYGLSEVEFSVDYKNAGGSIDEAKSIAAGFAESGCSIVVAFSSPAARAAQEALAASDAVLLYAAVNDPAAELLSGENSEVRMTGISSKTDVQAIMELISASQPKPSSLGTVYSADDQSSISAAAEVKKYCEENNVAYVDGIVTDSSALADIVKSTAGEADALFIPDDSLTGAKFSDIISAANELKKPVYSTSVSAVKSGAVAASGADYAEIGRKTADIAAQLIKGRDIGEIEPSSMSGYDIYINQTSLASLGISLSEDTLMSAVPYN